MSAFECKFIGLTLAVFQAVIISNDHLVVLNLLVHCDDVEILFEEFQHCAVIHAQDVTRLLRIAIAGEAPDARELDPKRFTEEPEIGIQGK